MNGVNRMSEMDEIITLRNELEEIRQQMHRLQDRQAELETVLIKKMCGGLL